MEARRPQLADLGLFLLVVALPLVFTPFSVDPFADPKVVVLGGAALALWASGLPIDRRLAWAVIAWVGVTFVAAIVGVDPSRGLTTQTSGQGGGLIVTLASAVLLLAGAGLGENARERARRWFVAACTAIALFGIIVRLVPDVFGSFEGLSFVGATMGNQLFAAALLSAGIVAAMGNQSQRLPRQLVLVGVLTLGFATFGERSAIALPLIGVIAFLIRGRLGWRRAAALIGCVILILLAWQGVAARIPAGGQRASVTGLTAQATDAQRFLVWRVVARGIGERPAFGWGPGSTQSAYVSNATTSELAEATRGWADAHDLFLETAITSGLVGVLTLALVVWIAVPRAVRCRPGRAWALGAAAALAAYALFEPINLVLTPLLFFLLGVAAGPPRRRLKSPARPPVMLVGGAGLGAALMVSVMMLTGASLERWGRAYSEEWAYRRALTVQPWRLSATERLAIERAVDSRSGDVAAGEEARSLIARAVDAHPLDVDVRIWASDIALLLRDPAGSRTWIQRHLERFPADREGLEQAATSTSTVSGAAP